MKRIYWLLVVALYVGVTSCGDSSKSKAGTHPKLSIEDVMNEFKECKESSSEKHSCKTYVAKAINGAFQIADFNNTEKEGEYIEYDKIFETLKVSGSWKKIGDATEQGALDYFQKCANEGKAVLAINSDSGHGNVAIGVPGEQVKSTSWGVKCPTVAIFFPNRPEKSFIGKTLNYAWSKPEGIELYCRE